MIKCKVRKDWKFNVRRSMLIIEIYLNHLFIADVVTFLRIIERKIVNLVWSGMTYGVKLHKINDNLHKVRKYLGIKLNFYFYVNERKSKDITLKVRHMFRVKMSITLFWLIEGHYVTIYASSLSKFEFIWNNLRITRL